MADEKIELTPADTLYPKELREFGDRAPHLYVSGNPEVLTGELFVVTGSRRATPYGLAVSRDAARVAIDEGYTLVNGGAIGCENSACREALGSGSPIVICSFCGPDIKPPSVTEDVFIGATKGGGAIVSFEPFGTHATAHAARRKNELMATLASALFVAEASLLSGTMHAADVALSAGRRVFAAPGPIYSETSSGTNELISSGQATMVVNMSALIAHITQSDQLTKQPGVLPFIEGAHELNAIIKALANDSATPQALAAQLDEDHSDVVRGLAQLEMRGIATRLPNGKFTLSHYARGFASTLFEAKAAQSTRQKADGAPSGIKQ